MKKFLKFLVLAALAANMVFLLVLDGRLPAGISLPFRLPVTEAAKEEEMTAEVPAVTETAEPEEDKKEEAGTEETEENPKTGRRQPQEPAESAETEEETETEEHLPYCRVISENGSNVRSGPGQAYEVIFICPYDTLLFIRGEAVDGWYPVQMQDGTQGYIFESQIGLPENFVPPADTEQE